MASSSPDAITHVGYIGMGIMGSAMAVNLLKAGYRVTVWNRTAAKCRPLVEAGASTADSPAAMAAMRPQVICTNVTDSPDVEHVLFGSAGVNEGAAPGLIVVDHSTISPTATQSFAARLAKQGVQYLDAPVSGGDIGARDGTLSVMVGGDAAVFERCRAMFEVIGKTVTHVGALGMGQVTKACNQIAGACNLMGVCEALALAKKMGLDPRKMLAVVSKGASASWSMTHLGPQIVDGDFQPGFMVDLLLKDLGIVADAAAGQGGGGQAASGQALPLPAVEQARAYLAKVAEQGGGRLGTQAIAQVVGKTD